MKGQRGGVVALWVVFVAVAITSGWIAVQMVGNAVSPASVPVLNASDVSARLATSSPDQEKPTPKPTKTQSKKKHHDSTKHPTHKPTPTTSPTPTPTSTKPRPSPSQTASSQPAVVRTLASRGGSVVAACRSGSVTLRSWSPAVGFRVSEVKRGPATEVEVRFVSKDAEVTMKVTCRAGVPAATNEYDSDSGDDD